MKLRLLIGMGVKESLILKNGNRREAIDLVKNNYWGIKLDLTNIKFPSTFKGKSCFGQA